MESTKFTPQQIKKNQKNFFITLISGLLFIILLFVVTSQPTLKGAKSVSEGKKAVDYIKPKN